MAFQAIESEVVLSTPSAVYDGAQLYVSPTYVDANDRMLYISANNVTVQNCSFIGAPWHLPIVYQSRWLASPDADDGLPGCNPKLRAIVIAAGVTGTTIKNCDFWCLPCGTGGAGIKLLGGNDSTTIDSCRFTNLYIGINHQGSPSSTGLTIKSCEFRDTWGWDSGHQGGASSWRPGGWIGGNQVFLFAANNVTMTNCAFHGEHFTPIKFAGNCATASIQGCHLGGITIAADTAETISGITMNRCHVIRGAHWRADYGFGLGAVEAIQLSGNVTGFTLTNSVVSNREILDNLGAVTRSDGAGVQLALFGGAAPSGASMTGNLFAGWSQANGAVNASALNIGTGASATATYNDDASGTPFRTNNTFWNCAHKVAINDTATYLD